MEKEIAQRLKQARIAAGYRTAKEFADKNDIPQPTYALHEGGRRGLKRETADRYAKLLNVSPGWLLTGEGTGPEVDLSAAPISNEWIEARLESLPGKNKSGLAEALELPPARVTEIIQGTRKVQVTELPVMARYLEMDAGKLLILLTGGAATDVIERPVSEMMVRGAVQAGYWAEAMEWPRDEWYPVPIPPDPRYASVERFGLEVRGPSMNKIYPEGTVLVCVSVFDILQPPKEGQRVVVERRCRNGLIEATVKELHYDEEGRAWLWPKSDHPEHQAPMRTDDGEEVEIRAVVIGSYRPE